MLMLDIVKKICRLILSIAHVYMYILRFFNYSRAIYVGQESIEVSVSKRIINAKYCFYYGEPY